MDTKTLLKLSVMGLLTCTFATADVYAVEDDGDEAAETAPKKKKGLYSKVSGKPTLKRIGDPS